MALGSSLLCMGVFGVAEILLNAEEEMKKTIYETEIQEPFPESRRLGEDPSVPSSGGRSSGSSSESCREAGLFFPASSHTPQRENCPKTPEEFGKGAIAGVAGPETSNNAAATSSFSYPCYPSESLQTR